MGLEGLPANYNYETVAAEIEGERLMEDFYGNEDRRKSSQQIALEGISKLNNGQRQAFDRFKAALNNENGAKKLFFLEGAGGCGKCHIFFPINCLF
jgi:hypothetical protein